ncbi:uncharacterized protein [Anoplolepis gracilipes]|uniref:uncharacterized protein isoform X2 n=1 Tax=Anoplolepis gracilipes TaxID=354296 RepID=UPI003BA01457
MSKYKCLRPAGMSDEDDDADDDDLLWGYLHNSSSSKNISETKNDLNDVSINEDRVRENDVSIDEDRVHENDVIQACVTGDLKVLQNHLENPSDVACNVDKSLHTGWTLLLYATSSVQPDIVEYLLKLDADPNKSKEGFTPLMALCNSVKGTTERSLKCLVYLMEAKANVNLTNKRRETALMYACTSQNAEFVAELIKHVKDINVCDSDGKAALSYAAVANKPDIVRILLEHNADTSLQDKNYLSAKDIADKKGFEEISALLTEEGGEEKPITCEVFDRRTWRDLFPDLYPRKKEVLDDYVSNMLSGMGLESYKVRFQGMDLKTFLQLTEAEVCNLGIDISVHREQFLEALEKFHHKKWNVIFGKQDNINPIYDNIITLANAKEKIAVIGASFQYIKNNLMKAARQNIYLSPLEILAYEKKLKETRKNLKNLKTAVIHIRKLARKIDKENDIDIPAIYIGSERVKKNNFNWIISLSVALMVGLYLCKTTYIQK